VDRLDEAGFTVRARPAADESRLAAAVDAAFDASRLRENGYAYVSDLDDGRRVRYRATTDVYPASIVKVAIMTEVYRRFQERLLRPDDLCVISASNVTPTAEPTPCASGYRTTIEHLTALMIERSDNVATNQLIDVMGRESVTHTMRAMGLANFHLGRKLSGAEPLVADPEATGRNRMSPEDIGCLLELIARDRVTGAARQREILARCVDDRKLAAGLRSDDRFAHKTGETSDTNHDAGILTTAAGRTYIIVLYTWPAPPTDSAQRSEVQMATWMRRLRQEL